MLQRILAFQKMKHYIKKNVYKETVSMVQHFRHWSNLCVDGISFSVKHLRHIALFVTVFRAMTSGYLKLMMMYLLLRLQIH